MTIAIWAVGAYWVAASITHIGSIAIAARRCRKSSGTSGRTRSEGALGPLGLRRALRRLVRRSANAARATGTAADVAGVSVVRPVCGLENHTDDTLRSAFELDYPRYEILFCAATANDAAVPLVKRLIAAHPHVPARLLIGNEAISENPKLNNVCKGWRAAAYDWVVMRTATS